MLSIFAQISKTFRPRLAKLASALYGAWVWAGRKNLFVYITFCGGPSENLCVYITFLRRAERKFVRLHYLFEEGPTEKLFLIDY